MAQVTVNVNGIEYDVEYEYDSGDSSVGIEPGVIVNSIRWGERVVEEATLDHTTMEEIYTQCWNDLMGEDPEPFDPTEDDDPYHYGRTGDTE